MDEIKRMRHTADEIDEAIDALPNIAENLSALEALIQGDE